MTFREEDHPRGRGDKGGQFIRKGESPGSSASTSVRMDETGRNLKSYLQMVAAVEKQSNAPYSKHDFVLKNGRQYQTDENTYKGKRGTPRLCYMNAGRAAMAYPNRLTYVEGFITVAGVPIQHAWTVDKEGRVLDPTLRDGNRVGGYFGVPFTADYVRNTALKTGVWGIISSSNPDLFSHNSLEGVVEGASGPDPKTSPAEALLAKNFKEEQVDFERDVIGKLSKEERAAMEKAEAEMREMVPTNVAFTKDGVYTQDRQKLHAEILDKMFSAEAVKKATPAAGKKPVLILTGGRPAAGKTSALLKEMEAEPGAIYISADEIQEKLPGYRGEHAGIYNGEGQDIALQAEKIAREAGLNIVYDATMKSTQPAVDRVLMYKDAGYAVHGYFVHTTPVNSALRSVQRFMGKSGRYVPPIISFKSRTNERTFDRLIPAFDKWALYDNNGSKPVKIAGSK